MTRTAIIAAMLGELKPLTRGWQHTYRNGVDLWSWRFDEGEWIAACAGAGVEAATRAFAGTGIRMRPLAANGQAPAVPKTAIGTHFDEPLDVQRNLFAEVAFHRALIVQNLTDLAHFFFREIRNLLVKINAGTEQD